MESGFLVVVLPRKAKVEGDEGAIAIDIGFHCCFAEGFVAGAPGDVLVVVGE